MPECLYAADLPYLLANQDGYRGRLRTDIETDPTPGATGPAIRNAYSPAG